MKRLIYISLLFIGFSSALRAQEIQLDSLVNIRFEGITLKAALNELSEKYDIRFSYSDSNIPVNDTIHASYNLTRLNAVFKITAYQS